MKLNYKIFKSLNDPVIVQNSTERHIEIHFMNNTPYFDNFTNKGQYAAWTSDGKSYKLLIEEGYYNEFQEIFTEEMNILWINYFEDIFKVRKRTLRSIWYPALVLLALLIVALLVLPSVVSSEPLKEFLDQTSTMFIFGAIIFLILINILSSSIFKRKSDRLQEEHFNHVEDILGTDRKNELAILQETYHRRFHQGEVKEPVQEVIEEPVVEEVVEVKEEPVVEEVPVVAAVPLVEEKESDVLKLLNLLTVNELREFLKDRNIPHYSTMNKKELIEALPSEIENLYVAELRVIAEKLELQHYISLNKPELIVLILMGLHEEKPEEVLPVEEKKFIKELNFLTLEQLRTYARNRRLEEYYEFEKDELINMFPEELEDLYVPELKAIAAVIQVPEINNLSKPELIYAIRKYRGVIEEPVVEEVIEEPVVVEEVVEVKEEPVVVVPVEEEPEEEKDPLKILNKLTVVTLRELVKERGIANYSAMRKSELIEAMPRSLEELHVPELKELAKAHEYKYYSAMNKPQLIDLLINGQELEEEPKVVVEPVVVEEVFEDKEPLEILKKLKVVDLREFVKERGISNYTTMNKTELVSVMPSTLEELHVPELKALAKALDYKHYSVMTKPELLDLIINGQDLEEKPVEKPVVKEVKEVKEKPVVVVPVEDESEDKEPLEILYNLKVVDLREFVKERGISNYTTMNKSGLVNAMPSTLEELHVPELKALAKALDYSHYSVMTKPELLDLIINGPKEVVEEVIVEEVVEDKEPLEILKKLKADDLREFLKERGIPNYTTMNKTGLVNAMPSTLEELHVPELKALAKALDYSNYSVMTKPELLDLIKNGPKEDEVEEVVVEEIVEDKEPLELLNILTVEVLREFVKLRELSNYSTMTKPELINTLPSLLEELRVYELKELVKAQGKSNYSVMTKPQLIEALTKEDGADEVEPNIDLGILTVNELKEFAKHRGVVNVGKMNKAELVNSLPKLIEQLHVPELKALAKKLEVPNYSSLIREELITEIKEKQENR